MTNPMRSRLWLAGLLGLVASIAMAAQQKSIQLPSAESAMPLKQASGDDVTRRNCSICHSTDYIVRQPQLDAPKWEAEVAKMIRVYSAPINAADAKTISDYLAKNYGAPAAPPAPGTKR